MILDFELYSSSSAFKTILLVLAITLPLARNLSGVVNFVSDIISKPIISSLESPPFFSTSKAKKFINLLRSSCILNLFFCLIFSASSPNSLLNQKISPFFLSLLKRMPFHQWSENGV